MSNIYIEDGYEKIFINFIRFLGYEYIPHEEIVRDSMKSPIASEILDQSLMRINPLISPDVLNEAIHKIKNIDAGILVNRNETFFEFLQNGIEVSYYDDDGERTERVYLIDYEDVYNNSFVVTNQLTIIGKDTKRPDVLIYVNGLPLVVVELKSMTTELADVS